MMVKTSVTFSARSLPCNHISDDSAPSRRAAG